VRALEPWRLLKNGTQSFTEEYLLNILGERRHLDGLGASKMLAVPSFLRGYTEETRRGTERNRAIL
jgi:hypothetical protein